MNIYPAIDLKNGQCIRLYQGDFTKETIYSPDPLAIAQQFIDSGAEWLHIVDLNGAKNPSDNQIDIIANLLKLNLKIQIGGGIRTKNQIEQLFALGAARVIIGSAAVTKEDEVKEWLNYFGCERLVIALDVVPNEQGEYHVASHAWNTVSQFSIYDLIDIYRDHGLQHVLCTNILLDGTLKGPDFNLYQSLLKKFPSLNVQASAGIQSLADIKQLREMGLSGAIIGRALYENKFTLREVLQC